MAHRSTTHSCRSSISSTIYGNVAGVRALVAGAGSRVFADCLRKTIMSRAAETVPVDPAGPAAAMDRSFLLHHIASSFVATVQWWAGTTSKQTKPT